MLLYYYLVLRAKTVRTGDPHHREQRNATQRNKNSTRDDCTAKAHTLFAKETQTADELAASCIAEDGRRLLYTNRTIEKTALHVGLKREDIYKEDIYATNCSEKQALAP